MKNQFNALKISFLGAAVAAFGVGCASSGYSSYDADHNHHGMGASAQTEMGAGQYVVNAEPSATVSALGRSVDTRADWVNRFPFYDRKLRTIETYTFVTDDGMRADAQGSAPGFETSLPEGSVYVEAAGGASPGEITRHTVNPTR